jgi:hypothetical protein
MPRRRSREGLQSNTLEQMGLEHDVPTPGFSDQPDSGGAIGGVRGRQEYGIEGGAAATLESEATGRAALEGNIVEEVQAPDAFSRSIAEEGEGLPSEDEQEEEQEQEFVLQERAPVRSEGEDLRNLIEDRLMRHPSIHLSGLHVLVQPVGLVTVGGRVLSEAEKLRVAEVISALPGIQGLRNLLTVGGS